jgi:hypothetical protein
VQVEGRPPHQVIHVVAERLLDMSDLLATLEEDAAACEEKGGLAIRSRDFH